MYPAFVSISLASASVVVPALISLLIASVFSAKDLPLDAARPAAIFDISPALGTVSKFLAVPPAICPCSTLAWSGDNVISILVTASRRIVLLPTVNILYTRSLVKSFTWKVPPYPRKLYLLVSGPNVVTGTPAPPGLCNLSPNNVELGPSTDTPFVLPKSKIVVISRFNDSAFVAASSVVLVIALVLPVALALVVKFIAALIASW